MVEHIKEETMTKEQFQEIINFAVEREREAQRFYDEAAEKAKWPHIKNMLMELKAQEEGHERHLLNLKLPKLQAAHIDPVPDLRLSDYMVEMDYSPEMDFQDIMVLAMKREEKAAKLYGELASTCTDPQVCKLFEMMSEEEKRHKFNLEKEYEETILQDN
jgi:rubrerythrin